MSRDLEKRIKLEEQRRQGWRRRSPRRPTPSCMFCGRRDVFLVGFKLKSGRDAHVCADCAKALAERQEKGRDHNPGPAPTGFPPGS